MRGGPVGQFHDPVQYTHGHRPAAFRTDPLRCPGLLRLKTDPAFAVPVTVILAFLGIKLDGGREHLVAVPVNGRAQGIFEGGKVKTGVKDVGLPSQLGR